MPSHWREPLDPARHKNWVHASVGGAPRKAPKDPLISAWSYFVKVPGFTFEFASVEQLAECLTWFQRDIPPSSADGFYTSGNEHWPRWFERLPPGLTRKSRRPEIVRALEAALASFGKPKLMRSYVRSSVLRVIREHAPSSRLQAVTLPREDPLEEDLVRRMLRYHGIEWEAVVRDLRPAGGTD